MQNAPFNKVLEVILPLPIYAVIIYTFWLPGYEKLFDYERTIPYYENLFRGSILDQLGMTAPLIYVVAVLELAIAAAATISLMRGEFLPKMPAPLLKSALWLSMAVFGMLGFGLRLIRDHEGAANQFYYLGVTVFFLAFIQHRESHGCWQCATCRKS